METITLNYPATQKNQFNVTKRETAMNKQYKNEIEEKSNQPVATYLAEKTGISKTKIKDAMAKGAVWLTRGSARKRLRRVTAELEVGDVLELFYDENILNSPVPEPILLRDENDFTVWYKPSGLMTQGTDFGDHCALEHFVEKHFDRRRPVFLVHRIDREASGLVLIAHTKRMAAELSRLFRDQLVDKYYWIFTKGLVGNVGDKGIIKNNLDGKKAETHYEVLAQDKTKGESLMLVNIKTGRRHQIRRHFDMLGYPVIGDPAYGTGNKNRTGMKLAAWLMRFDDPVTGVKREYDLTKLYSAACAEYQVVTESHVMA